MIGYKDTDFNDFVEKFIDWNPDTKISTYDALNQIWVLKGLPPQIMIHQKKFILF